MIGRWVECFVASPQVTLDNRSHGTESLLHPLLSEAQGPALLIHLKDVTIGFDDLIRLTSPTRLRGKSKGKEARRKVMCSLLILLFLSCMQS